MYILSILYAHILDFSSNVLIFLFVPIFYSNIFLGAVSQQVSPIPHSSDSILWQKLTFEQYPSCVFKIVNGPHSKDAIFI